MPALALLVPFALIALFLALYGMHMGSANWLRPLLEEFMKPRGGFFKRTALAPLRALARHMLTIEHRVQATIARALLRAAPGVAEWLLSAQFVALTIAWEIEQNWKGIEEGLTRLKEVVIPRHVDAKVRPVERTAKLGHSLGIKNRARLEAEARTRARGIDRLRRDEAKARAAERRGIEAGIRTHVLPRIRADERAIERIRTEALPGIRTRERADRRAISRHETMIRRLAKILTVAGLATLMGRVLIRWQLGCLRGSKFKRFLWRLCGMDSFAFDALMALLFGTIAYRDFDTLISLMQKVEREAITEVAQLLGLDYIDFDSPVGD